MLNIIAEQIWDKIKWISLTEDELEDIILKYVKDPDDMYKVKDMINTLSIKE